MSAGRLRRDVAQETAEAVRRFTIHPWDAPSLSKRLTCVYRRSRSRIGYRTPHQGAKRISECVRVNRRSVRPCEDKASILNAFPKLQAVFILLGVVPFNVSNASWCIDTTRGRPLFVPLKRFLRGVC